MYGILVCLVITNVGNYVLKAKSSAENNSTLITISVWEKKRF